MNNTNIWIAGTGITTVVTMTLIMVFLTGQIRSDLNFWITQAQEDRREFSRRMDEFSMRMDKLSQRQAHVEGHVSQVMAH